MASVRYSPIVADVRGAIGGAVFSRSSSGPVVRTRSKPIPHTSEATAIAKSRQSQLCYHWKNTCSVANRQAWADHAAVLPLKNSLGQTFHGTGWNWYLRSNIAALQAGDPIRCAPSETIWYPQPFFTCAFVPGAKVQVTDVHDWIPKAGTRVLIQQAYDIPATIHSYSGPWHFTTRPFAADVAATPYTFHFYTRPAWPTAAFVQFKYIRGDARSSDPWTIRIAIPAA